jgi:putative ATP-dependent endonuclease of OLD family
LLEEIRDTGDKPGLVPTGAMPPEDTIKELAFSVLKNEKGSGYAGRLIELCALNELPPTLIEFMKAVYAEFKKPAPVPPIEAAGPAEPVAPIVPIVATAPAPQEEM